MGRICSRCQFKNRDAAKYCIQCGAELNLNCPQCGKILPSAAKFCDECGSDIKAGLSPPLIKGERKSVTVIFSDISGYTSMSERLDPEELKEVTSLIFGQISAIIDKYDGFIEKYVGDAIVAFFGAHKAHEDDPVRAIHAAREIHELVDALSPQYEHKIGQSLSMHTGINTGIAVTGEIDFQKGTHGVVGDAINLAARLSSLGKAGEILVGPDTYNQSEGYFCFEEQEPTKIKGKTKPLTGYRVLSRLDQPRKTHRLHGLRADLVGRRVELGKLKDAADKLRDGIGSIFFICGPPGTGKSRLIEEFKETLDLEEIQWREGHAYPYAQNIPYFPLINLLNRAFQIGESDSPDRIKDKIERGVENLIGSRENITPYLGSLYNLDYEELEGINPEFWKNQLQNAIQSILSAMAEKQPIIICLEDLHWADPSSLELFRLLISETHSSILFLCIYRPTITLFTPSELSRIAGSYHDIQLQDLSSAESLDMLESLLGTESVPSALRHFIEEKVEGNPFYLEEAINSLIDSEILVKEDGLWELTRTFTDADISRSIQGVISARLDRLDKQSKRVLQEASVIGRSFPFKVLKRITDHKTNLQNCLDELVRLDFLRVNPFIKDLEYVFKHAIIQEVVYSGLLREDCKEIHERIGQAIEKLFQRRIAEFSETLAFHYQKGQSLQKAVAYLMRSGVKSMNRYSVEESHRYYKEAYNLLTKETSRDQEDKASLIKLLNTWAPVFYFRGSFKELEALMKKHLDLADSLEDKEERGMFYVWLGMSLWGRARFEDAYRYLHTALKIGEEARSKRVIGYVGAWLPWPCVEVGLFEEALVHADRAREMSENFEKENYPYYQSLDSTAFVYFAMGRPSKVRELGEKLLEYGQKKSQIRAITWGYYVKGWSYLASGDFSSSILYSEQAIQSSPDPFYTQFPKLSLGMSYVSSEDYEKARDPLNDLLRHSQIFGSEVLGTAAQVFLGVVAISTGYLTQGMNMVLSGQKSMLENQARWRYSITELVLGEIFLNISLRKKIHLNLSLLVREFCFLLKNVPFAGRRAEQHYKAAIESAKAIGANGIQGQAYLGLGRLHAAKKKRDRSVECLSIAIQIFEECEAKAYLEETKKALASVKKR
jgi:class 3 adenylate cyclase/tetratricopeptide (TPR) repeat protein